ncbi:SH3 domain-containing protein [Clostridium perfringens]|nr:SH3 domain-containing protein [Clostridium perfringens]
MIKNNIIPDVNPGDIVGDSPTFPTNAKVVGDELYLRDEEGNIIHGRSVDDGDSITVLDISYGRQLALIQYPTGSGYRQGYVTNAISIIKYNDNYSWVNGSTEEAVYDLDKETQIGTLDPRERAVILYKVDGMTAVAYDTGKGKLTKSGLVYYEGSGTGGGSTGSGVRHGDIVKDGFTYDNNAQVVGDELYLRDENGNIIPGRSVSDGDNITVLDVGYTKQLALVQYPAGDVVRQGYVTNDTNLIKYFNQSMWHNGSTEEEVFDENGGHLGSLNPYEAATPLYKKNGMTHVVYDTIKGSNTKSGYVKYEGSVPTRVDIPYPSVTNAEKIVYGTSGKGRELAAYRIGNGQNSLVFVCAIHGWEDNWPADGVELTKIGNGLIEHFQNNKPSNWSLYIIPAANPDGVSEGFTNNGPGRCTIVGAVDCNRDFPLGFSPGGVPRYHSGSEPLSVSESKGLHDFIQDIKNGTSGEMCVIDLHGWEGAAIGNPEIGQYFRNEFGFEQRYGYGDNRGFMIGWAKSIGAKAALIELPGSTRSHSDVVNGRYLQKIINAVTNITGSSSVGEIESPTTSDAEFETMGRVVDVQTFLNVRKGPGTSYDSIGQLYEGNIISIIAKNSGWYKIRFKLNYGYVKSSYIEIFNFVSEEEFDKRAAMVKDMLGIYAMFPVSGNTAKIYSLTPPGIVYITEKFEVGIRFPSDMDKERI